MSRLYIGFILCFISFASFSQQDLKRYLDFAREKYKQGDYVYSLEYYQKAMQLDSNTVNTLWEYAEVLRAYKDYRKAAYYYGEVYSREEGEMYPNSLLYYGLMTKQTGDYEKAIEIFKKAKKLYRRLDARGYAYKKSRVELESCIWAKANQGDFSDLIMEPLPDYINTKNAEFAHRVEGNTLYFSSLRADSISAAEEVYSTTYKTQIYSSEIKEQYGKDELVDGVNWDHSNSGNGTFSLDKKRFYFSHCRENGHNYQCKILVAYVDKGKFVDIDTLGEIINYPGANTTMPFIGEWDGEEVLFYASDRIGGKGGMDIWYSFIKNGNSFKKPINIKMLNSEDNELSPFWDSAEKTLYFSSSWYDGFGGYDVFKSTYTSAFGEPENLLEPINSPANDLYYFKTSTKDSAYVSSNRLGSNYSKNPTCCSDIYLFRKEIQPEPPTIEETLEDLNKRLPVTLYFHNDIPNPRSWDTTTTVNYIDSYNDYIGMLDQYKKEYSAGLKAEKAEDAKEDIEDFFIEYVEQGVKDLNQFIKLLTVELEKGHKIEMTVKGFASPLAKTDYNVNLAKRRITSLKNYLRNYQDGLYIQYLDKTAPNGAELRIKEIPYGEYVANQLTSDNPNDVKNSVFSRAAAIERKIEIQSVDIIRQEDTLITLLSSDNMIHVAGKQKEGTEIETFFTIKNEGETPIQMTDFIITDNNPNVIVSYSTTHLEPGESIPIKLSFDTTGFKGHQIAEVEIRYNGVEKGLKLAIVAEIE